nr:MAG TPA: hypothetical protein [Caudoviricetes sp.]
MYYETIKWVQGLEGAKSYQLMPNSNVVLMDSENDGMFYIKSSDNVGMCKIRTFKYEEVQQKEKEYITRDELMEMLKELKNEQTIPRNDKSKNESSRGNGIKVKNDE